MAILLSDHLKINAGELTKRGIFDAVIGIDTKLFIDPTLLVKTKIPEFRNSRKNLLEYFSNVITLIQFGQNQRTKSQAIKKLTFPEPEGVSIGYGNDNDDGAGVGPEKAEIIFNSALEIYNLGIKDPEIIELVGIFEEGFGPDLISDMTINIVRDDICRFTERVGRELNINLGFRYKDFNLPKHPNKEEYLLFIPKEFLCNLPVAANWEEVFVVAQHNVQLRDKVNALLKDAFGKKKKPTKKDFRNALWNNKSDLVSILKIYKEFDANSYDFENDPDGWGNWYRVGSDIYRNGKYSILRRPENAEEMHAAATELIQRYKKAIEDNSINNVIYGIRQGQLKPYREEVSQLIFFAMADGYCKDRNIILAREPNAGPGPVDFFLGTSYDAKVLIELKKSSNDVVAGYKEQLSAYERSENACGSFYVILRLSDKSSKIDEVLKIEKDRNNKKVKTPTVVVIDARLRESPSRRK